MPAGDQLAPRLPSYAAPQLRRYAATPLRRYAAELLFSRC